MLKNISEYFTYHLIKLHPGTRLADSVEFFIYDTIKIFLLLSIIIFAISIIRSYFPPEKTKKILSHKKEFMGNVLAALLGIVTPFCSCSAVPLFIGFVEAGVPLGVTFSFLIAAPMVNEVAVVLLFGLVGWHIAVLYVALGLGIAIVSGWVIGRFKMERHVEGFVYEMAVGQLDIEEKPSWADRLRRARQAVREIVGRVWPFVVAAIAVGAGIQGCVPEDFLADVMGKGAWWTVPAAGGLGGP